jgi:proton-translocating NADH-quinone oxidoreductase chain M
VSVLSVVTALPAYSAALLLASSHPLTAVQIWLETVGQPLPSASPSATPATFGAGVFSFSFLLSPLVWGPALMAAVIGLMPNPRGRYERWFLGIALATSISVLGLTLIGYQQFQAFTTGLQFEEKLPWLPALGISYHLGVDGIGVSMLLLSALVGVCGVVASWEVRDRPRSYFALLLLMEASVNGAVVARDFFLFFLFWSAAVVPLALLVAGWSDSARSQGAVWRLLGHWGLGSAALLTAGLLLYRASGGSDFDLDTLTKATPSARVELVIAILLVVAAASRLPLVPLHGWAREVLAEAPAGVAILTTGAAARLGGYVLIRLLAAGEHNASRTLAPYLSGLAVLTVGYAALSAFRARDLRRLGAYLALVPGAITTLGVAGLSPLSLEGAVLSLFAGGLAAALVVGATATLSERAQTRSLTLAAGLAGRAPKLAWLLLLGAVSVLCVPFLATFPAGLMVFLGSFRNQPAGSFLVALGLVLCAAAVGWMLHRVLFGAANPDAPTASDASLSESWYLGILVGTLLWVGLVPGGPKLFGVPLFDPGLVTVVNSSTPDLTSPYAVPTPTATPSPSSSPRASPSPGTGASPAPTPAASP